MNLRTYLRKHGTTQSRRKGLFRVSLNDAVLNHHHTIIVIRQLNDVVVNRLRLQIIIKIRHFIFKLNDIINHNECVGCGEFACADEKIKRVDFLRVD